MPLCPGHTIAAISVEQVWQRFGLYHKMTMRRASWVVSVVLLSVLGHAEGAATEVDNRVDWQSFLARHDLTWESLPAAWDAGAFLGNGLLGAMIYLDRDGGLRWDIGRSDVTDHRGKPGESPNATFDRARLPIGRFELQPVGKIVGGTMRLDLWNAEARGTLKTDAGQVEFRSFVHAVDSAIVVELKTEGRESQCAWKWIPDESKSTRTRGVPTGYQPNPPPQSEQRGDVSVCVQPLLVGGQYATASCQVGAQSAQRVLVVSVGNSFPGNTAADEAVAAVTRAKSQGVSALVASHRAWWHGFYPASFISIPDTRLESFYWIQMYKLASATRADRPAIDLMGPWFRTTGWPAIWWNLNIQLTYYPVYTANRLELGESLCRMLDAGAENLAKNVKPEYQHDSAAIGRVSGYDCRGSVANEVGNLTWACHNYWRQCRWAADDQRLRTGLYPLLRRAVNYYLHLLQPGADGRLHLPETYSPEYGTAVDCNYDLALLRWGCTALLDTCRRLSIDDPLAPRWQEVLDKLTPYPVGDGGLWIGRDVPLAKSHRHYSHLLMIYPLRLVRGDTPAERGLIESSLDHWIGFEGALQGYSFTGASSISSAIGRRDEAAKLLNSLVDRYVRPNTMYLEGSPVIETPLSGAESIHDMLLQSGGGVIRLFPGVPDSWKDVTIHRLRGEGAFLVSAARRGGRTLWTRVESLAGEPVRIKLDFAPAGHKLEADGTLALSLKRGESIVLWPGPSGTVKVEPVAANAQCNWFGSRKVLPVSPNADGSIDLPAAKAEVHGEFLFYEKSKVKDDLGRWISPNDWASWKVNFARPGRYAVRIDYGSPSSDGRALRLTVGTAELLHRVEKTGGFDAFQPHDAGVITVAEPGSQVLAVRPHNAPKGLLINLRGVHLTPAAP